MLTELEKVVPKKTAEYYEMMHQTALIHDSNGNLPDAEKYPRKAAQGRKKLFGKRNTDFYASMNLLADIYDKMGDKPAAQVWRLLIPITSPELGMPNGEVVASGYIDSSTFMIPPPPPELPPHIRSNSNSSFLLRSDRRPQQLLQHLLQPPSPAYLSPSTGNLCTGLLRLLLLPQLFRALACFSQRLFFTKTLKPANLSTADKTCTAM